MSFVPNNFRLKDPALIERWRELAPYVNQAPPAGTFVVLVNREQPEWLFGLRRADSMQSAAFFTKMEASDANELDRLDEGDKFSPVMTEYKIDGKRPFIIRRTRVADMKVGEGNLDLAEEKKRFGWFKTLLTTFHEMRSGILIPDTEELDELLEFLRGAEPLDPEEE